MKFSDVKTQAQFWEFADVWYQRMHKLREVWQNPNETTERALKALSLWEIMKGRVLLLFNYAKMFSVYHPKN